MGTAHGTHAWHTRTAHTHGTAAQLAAHTRTARIHAANTHTRCPHTLQAPLYLPLLQAAAFASYDLVMLDEAHDCTACQVGQIPSDLDLDLDLES